MNCKPLKCVWNFYFTSNHCHCVKSARIWSFSGPYFPAFGLNIERYFSDILTSLFPEHATLSCSAFLGWRLYFHLSYLNLFDKQYLQSHCYWQNIHKTANNSHIVWKSPKWIITFLNSSVLFHNTWQNFTAIPISTVIWVYCILQTFEWLCDGIMHSITLLYSVNGLIIAGIIAE